MIKSTVHLVLTVECASEAVRAVLDNTLHRLLGVGVLVHIHGHHWAKDLLLEDLLLGGGRLHDGRLDEVPDALVEAASGHDGAVGGALCMLDVAGNPSIW